MVNQNKNGVSLFSNLHGESTFQKQNERKESDFLKFSFMNPDAAVAQRWSEALAEKRQDNVVNENEFFDATSTEEEREDVSQDDRESDAFHKADDGIVEQSDIPENHAGCEPSCTSDGDILDFFFGLLETAVCGKECSNISVNDKKSSRSTSSSEKKKDDLMIMTNDVLARAKILEEVMNDLGAQENSEKEEVLKEENEAGKKREDAEEPQEDTNKDDNADTKSAENVTAPTVNTSKLDSKNIFASVDKADLVDKLNAMRQFGMVVFSETFSTAGFSNPHEHENSPTTQSEAEITKQEEAEITKQEEAEITKQEEAQNDPPMQSKNTETEQALAIKSPSSLMNAWNNEREKAKLFVDFCTRLAKELSDGELGPDGKPVVKGVYLVACLVSFIFWPSNLKRRVVQRPLDKSEVSLLKLATGAEDINPVLLRN